MLKYIFKQAFRNLKQQKQSTLINITGLVVAICTILFIAVWVMHEKSYDKHHSKSDRIYRLSVEEGSREKNNLWHFARTWQEWRRELTNFYPEIEELAELAPTFNTVVRIEDNSFYEKGFSVKPNIFNVFDFEFLLGDPETVLENTHSIIISESLANKYFLDLNPIGQTVELKGSYIDEEAQYTITGVYRDIPTTSHFHSEFFVHYTEPKGENQSEWAFTYLLLKKDSDIKAIQKRLPDFIKTHIPENQQESLIKIYFTPLTDIHLKSHIEREIEPNGDIKHVRLFISVTIGVFIIALINFINLLIVSFGRRISSININRVVGAGTKHNILQLMIEASIISLVSITISIILFKPLFYLLSNFDIIPSIDFNKSIYLNLLFILLIVFLVVSLAGIVPFYLLKLKNIRSGFQNTSEGLGLKRINFYNKPLLVIQFSISILVIIGSLILNKQNNFLFSQNLGHKDDNIILLNRNFWSEEDKMMLLKSFLEKNPNVENHCAIFEPPTYLNKDARQIKTSKIPGGFTDYSLSIFVTDHSLFDLFNIPLVAGRAMKPYVEGQKYEEYVLNESAVKKMGFKSNNEVLGIDFTVKPYFDGIIHGGKVVGVVKDFNYTSLYHPIQPTVYFQKPIWQWHVLIKFVPGNLEQQLKSLKKDWVAAYPDYPFDYEIVSDLYKEAYKKDITVNKLLNLFSIFCIIISSIGLLGISSILLINKTKEIGVRKVNGAKIPEIILMFNKDFIRWILVAFVIACPIAFYTMNKWLQDFAYRTEISWWIFVLAGFFALLIALLTISIQSYKAANKNPVEALRYE